MFTDKCNDCGADIEIDMKTFLYIAHCSCDSDIKKSIGETREMTFKANSDAAKWGAKMLKNIEPPKRNIYNLWGLL